jgi:hypothetical protein
MKKRELEKKIRELELHLKAINEYMCCSYPTKNQLFRRDYIVRTKGIGKMKDKKLIEDFKKEFPNYDDIQNYEFEKLNDYYETLKLYEKKQIVIDVYGTKA